jgi:flagellar M-ring protein FliF
MNRGDGMNEIKLTLTQMWEGLSGPRKLSLIGTMILVAALLASIVYYASQPKFTLLYSGLSTTEAAKVADYLKNTKTAFELQDGGATVMVPANKVYELRLDLAAKGIPRAGDTAGGVGFELFDQPSFGMSDFMQKANYYRALQGELARTISQMEEVEQARVMIVVPESRLFSREKDQAKASVFIKLKSGRVMEPGQVQAVQFLVASGVEGMQPARVSVVDQSGRALTSESMGDNVISQSNGQLSMRKAVETHLREKAQSMLDQVLGPGQAVVQIAAELNFDAIQQTSETYDPKSSVLRSETTSTENNVSRTAGEQGSAVGARTNSETQDPNAAPAGATASAEPVTSSQQQRENVNNRYEISRTVQTRQQSVGDIKRLTIAVFVNKKKTTVAGNEQAKSTASRTPEEMDSLSAIVKQAIGYVDNDSRKDNLQLTEVEFANMFDEAPVVAEKSMMQGVEKWVPYASQAFLILLGLAVLLYIRSIVKASSQEGQTVGNDFDKIMQRFESLNKEIGIESEANASIRNGSLTLDDMSKLIRDNPTNTAQAIKQWLARS